MYELEFLAGVAIWFDCVTRLAPLRRAVSAARQVPPTQGFGDANGGRGSVSDEPANNWLQHFGNNSIDDQSA